RQPLNLFHRAQPGAVLRSKLSTNRLEIIARIKTFRDRSDVFAERLAITEESGACEHINLCARIVHVILAGDAVAGKAQQVRERITENRTTTMADMHGPCRIGGNVLDVDFLAFADVAPAIV